jgi:hypothetical protein
MDGIAEHPMRLVQHEERFVEGFLGESASTEQREYVIPHD